MEFGSEMFVVTMAVAVAEHAPVTIDGMTLGLHPDPEQREAGEVALFDRAGALLAEGEDAGPVLVVRAGLIRSVGAILAAVEHIDPDELVTYTALAISSRWLEENAPAGAPADAPLRLGLCARAVALDALGAHGDIADTIYARRGTSARLGLHPFEHATWATIGMLELDARERAMLGATC